MTSRSRKDFGKLVSDRRDSRNSGTNFSLLQGSPLPYRLAYQGSYWSIFMISWSKKDLDRLVSGRQDSWNNGTNFSCQPGCPPASALPSDLSGPLLTPPTFSFHLLLDLFNKSQRCVNLACRGIKEVHLENGCYLNYSLTHTNWTEKTPITLYAIVC